MEPAEPAAATVPITISSPSARPETIWVVWSPTTPAVTVRRCSAPLTRTRTEAVAPVPVTAAEGTCNALSACATTTEMFAVCPVRSVDTSPCSAIVAPYLTEPEVEPLSGSGFTLTTLAFSRIAEFTLSVTVAG